MIGYIYNNGNPFGFTLMLFAAIVVIVLVLIQNAKTRKMHTDTIIDFSLRNNLKYAPDDNLSVINRYYFSKLMGQGHDKRAENLVYGKIKDRDFIFFDYRYRTGSGKNEQSFEFGVASVELPIIFSDLYIRAENVMDKIAGAIGFNDINFESEEFNRAFYVKSSNKKFAYDIINSAAMQLLLENREWIIELNSNSILFYKSRIFSVEDYEKVSSFANNFIDIIPEYIMNPIQRN